MCWTALKHGRLNQTKYNRKRSEIRAAAGSNYRLLRETKKNDEATKLDSEVAAVLMEVFYNLFERYRHV